METGSRWPSFISRQAGRCGGSIPALGLLVAELDERRVSKTLSSEYVTSWFHLTADDRLALKRFATRVGAVD